MKAADRERRSGWSRAAISLVVVGFLVTGACGKEKAAPAVTHTLRAGVLTSVDHLPLYAMVDEGFAAAEGLRLTEVPAAGGTAVLAGLVDGTLDIGTVGVVSLAAGVQAGTVPGTVIGVMGAIFVSPEHPLIAVLAADGVPDFATLSGRRVAVNSKTSLGAAGLAGRLARAGLAPAELVEVPFGSMGLAVRNGDVSAAVVLEPYLTQSVKRGDGHLLGWVVGGSPMERVQSSIVSIRKELATSNPAAIRSYIRAHLAAQRWIERNPKDARDLLARRLSISPEVAADIVLPSFDNDGRNDNERIQPILDLLNAATPGVDASTLYDERLLRAADPPGR